MNINGKHPIIANGQYYIEPLTKRKGGGTPSFPHEYGEAKFRLCSDIRKIQDSIRDNEEVFLDEKIVCIRLEPKYEAKSYTPNSLVTESGMKLVGGRKYSLDSEDSSKAKMYFVRTNDSELAELKSKFETGKKDHVNKWKEQVCTIKSIDLLRPEEKAMGFSDSWEKGTVEVVIHPLGEDYDKAVDRFFDVVKISKSEAVVRTYEDGLTFVCMHMDRESMALAQKYNPLRSIKPMRDDWQEQIRVSSMVAPAPQLPNNILKSSIKVGVFDGGVPSGTKLLDPYVDNYDMVKAEPTEESLNHGANVCGAILYGTGLAGKMETDTVDNPLVSIESFRVLPSVKTDNLEADYQMYTTIDIIEKVVTERSDIKVYNLSFGPRGAIIDDEINRFTYVCDRLTYNIDDGEVNPLFCIAAGNDGTSESPFNRIQSPADMVNGLAVGAYTLSQLNDKYRAPYSCVGPGREGAKIKPDILEFGGTTDRPFISTKSGDLVMGTAGTSLAAPVVAGKIGRLMAASDQIVPHMGRTLLIHSAESEGTGEHCFGFCIEDVKDILNCSDNKVTILYEGDITSSATVKLPIFAPGISEIHGNADIKWTICTVVNPNINDTDAYTNNCIEDTFYPNDMKFTFRKNKIDKHLNLLKDTDINLARELLKQGYSKSELPVSKSAKQYFAEADLRNNDFKWDTIIRKNIRMRCSSLLNPFISLHAIGRDEYEHEKIKYFVVITIDVPKFKGSLYDYILQTYDNLLPIRIQNVNRIMTQIN